MTLRSKISIRRTLEKFANAYSISENDLETLLAKELLRKKSQLPTSREQFISFIAPYNGAFGCLYKLLLIAVTLPVTNASCERIFFKNEISENISQKFHDQ